MRTLPLTNFSNIYYSSRNIPLPIHSSQFLTPGSKTPPVPLTPFQVNILQYVISDTRRRSMYALKRNPSDSRSGKDRRRIFSPQRIFYRGPERRSAVKDRRSLEERRNDWVRIDRWSSVPLQDLKIARFLR